MRSLFRSFERFGLDYLLISGQASILYGAATFSEDIDIWVRPSPQNLARMLRALASCRARFYKLTPPVTVRFARAGHGFHFAVPGRIPTYLDVMGRPPRVGSFDAAARRARWVSTAWGRLPVVSIEDLVALKKTRRLADYDVITNLVQARLREEPRPGRGLLRWAARNAFRAEDRLSYLRRLGASVTAARCRAEISRELARCQARDTAYWRRIIRELRRLRADDRLVPLGLPVAAVVPQRPRVNRGGGPGASAARTAVKAARPGQRRTG
jgi:hypothetical protein